MWAMILVVLIGIWAVLPMNNRGTITANPMGKYAEGHKNESPCDSVDTRPCCSKEGEIVDCSESGIPAHVVTQYEYDSGSAIESGNSVVSDTYPIAIGMPPGPGSCIAPEGEDCPYEGPIFKDTKGVEWEYQPSEYGSPWVKHKK